MTAVARVLPRNWDGHRLLRFLAGLAMLALAFTSPVPATPMAPPAAVTAEASTTVAVSESAPAPSAVRVLPAPRPTPAVAIIVLVSLVVLVGVSTRIRGERAPPAIG
ncbi:hypothetical protein BJ973_009333 [Actinoplanes tereljensis]|uniref:hypothetical protein n=1 Tax=Paractinoplanes tereljensis TaxID=571912 RepID=UPI001941762B|nr:hypothetical protein [Actinoplanes tereljensis]